MNIIEGDLFALVKEHDGGNVIIHGCNCMGAFAAGVAGLVAKHYPDALDAYTKSWVKLELVPGQAQYVFIENDIVINAMTQVYPGVHASLELIESAFDKIIKCLKLLAERSLIGYERVWLPAIGSGIGGLAFDDCMKLYKKLDVLEEYGYEVNLVLYK